MLMSGQRPPAYDPEWSSGVLISLPQSRRPDLHPRTWRQPAAAGTHLQSGVGAAEPRRPA